MKRDGQRQKLVEYVAAQIELMTLASDPAQRGLGRETGNAAPMKMTTNAIGIQRAVSRLCATSVSSVSGSTSHTMPASTTAAVAMRDNRNQADESVRHDVPPKTAVDHFDARIESVVSQSRCRIVDRRNTDLGEAKPAGDVHRRHHVLMARVGVGADRQRQSSITAGHLLQRVPDRFRPVVDEFPAVDQVRALLRDHDLELLAALLRQRRRYPPPAA